MKTKILFLTLLIFTFAGYSQDQLKQNLPEVKVTPPEFTNIRNITGLYNNSNPALLINYLEENTVYPKSAGECFEEGTAVVRFLVTSKGEVTDFKVINSICPLIDDEIVRVLSTTNGMWKPGLNNLEPVDMEKEVSMMFVANQSMKNSPAEYFVDRARKHFIKAGTLYFKKNNPKKAFKFYCKAVKYRPYDVSGLLLRGLCRYELGDIEGARNDWERINAIGPLNTDEYIQYLVNHAGYDEMMLVLKK